MKKLIVACAFCFFGTGQALSHDLILWGISSPLTQIDLTNEVGKYKVCFVGGTDETVSITIGQLGSAVRTGGCLTSSVKATEFVRVSLGDGAKTAFGTIELIPQRLYEMPWDACRATRRSVQGT
eukprot:TRINITY_DN81028_c0_g1_i1.p1 TRINITY_DN81028_c0_g1~~TRINITY_DN81028_c0_g1_i1.p1  ORF type:complete len:138 (-),score=3.46 TRINITY_DN81028_c0_g1_i1:104-475(-)